MQELILEVVSVFTQNVKKHCIYTQLGNPGHSSYYNYSTSENTCMHACHAVLVYVYIGSVYSHYMMEYI